MASLIAAVACGLVRLHGPFLSRVSNRTFLRCRGTFIGVLRYSLNNDGP